MASVWARFFAQTIWSNLLRDARDSRKQLPKMNFRQKLQEEYLLRCDRNNRYTVSAFARSLKMDVSTLTKILKGQRKVGNKALLGIASKLGWSPEDLKPFVKSKKSLGTGAWSEPGYQQLSLDQFRIMADWYHYAILELMTVEGFKPDASFIAQSLKITVAQAQIAIERLTRAGLIEVQTDGSWKDTSGGFSTTIGNEFTAGAFKKMQGQILDQAREALDQVDFKKRSQTSMTMAVDPSRLPEAQALIKEFRRKLNALMSENGNHQEVYQLSVSLFPVTEIVETKKMKAKGEGK
ncbi:MAG: DUF4423 domain-containing protein [Xanthomonadaceae bacterium]|nr:DUF4423 domain-containing protein [Xanthomonadaceae bacterium]